MALEIKINDVSIKVETFFLWLQAAAPHIPCTPLTQVHILITQHDLITTAVSFREG